MDWEISTVTLRIKEEQNTFKSVKLINYDSKSTAACIAEVYTVKRTKRGSLKAKEGCK